MRQKESKFIQIISHDGCLYAIDDKGVVWRRRIHGYDMVWVKQTMRRLK